MSSAVETKFAATSHRTPQTLLLRRDHRARLARRESRFPKG